MVESRWLCAHNRNKFAVCAWNWRWYVQLPDGRDTWHL